MEKRGNNALIATLVVLGLVIGPPAYAADEALGGIDVPCSPKTGQRIVYRMTQTMTDEYGSPDRAANTVAYDYLAGPDHIDGRITHAGGTLPFTFQLSKNFELEKIVLDKPGSIREDGLVIHKRLYGPLFEQANAFCGQRWTPGESRRIDLPLVPVLRFKVKEERRLDTQMSRF
jgi:hypothetical protein